MRPLQLMDLPDTVLQHLFFTLMRHDMNFADFALCNCNLLKMLLRNRAASLALLLCEPWHFSGQQLVLRGQHARVALQKEPRILHWGHKFLMLGWAKTLQLDCTLGAIVMSEDNQTKLGFKDQIDNRLVEVLLQDWPSNRVVMSYPVEMFTT